MQQPDITCMKKESLNILSSFRELSSVVLQGNWNFVEFLWISKASRCCNMAWKIRRRWSLAPESIESLQFFVVTSRIENSMSSKRSTFEGEGYFHTSTHNSGNFTNSWWAAH